MKIENLPNEMVEDFNYMFDTYLKEDILKKSFVVFPDNPDVLMAIDAMRGMYESTSVKYFNRNKKNLEDIMDYLDTSVLTEGRDGNLSERLKIAEKCFKIKAEFDELEKNVEADQFLFSSSLNVEN